MKLLHAPQLSSEWFQHHGGRISGSYMKAVLGTPARRLAYFKLKLGERLTGEVLQDNYVSREMKDGLEREPAARAAYELECDVMIDEVGFVVHDEFDYLGGSFDGVVLDKNGQPTNGGLELKCPKAGTHAMWCQAQRVPPEHLAQIHTYIAIGKFDWIDFMTYHPFVAREMRTMIIRVERDERWVSRILQASADFHGELEALIADLQSKYGPFQLPEAQHVMAGRIAVPEVDNASDAELIDDEIAWAQGGFQKGFFDDRPDEDNETE